MAQFKGTIAWFNNDKGYGFVSQESGPDLFIHYTALQSEGYKSLQKGDSVDFDVERGPTGKEQAANVTKLKRNRPKGTSIRFRAKASSN